LLLAVFFLKAATGEKNFLVAAAVAAVSLARSCCFFGSVFCLKDATREKFEVATVTTMVISSSLAVSP
jgi:hypothetical protein